MCSEQGRALINCPVGNFSEGASLQGRAEVGFGFAGLANNGYSKNLYLCMLGFGALFFASFLLGKQKNRSEAELGEAK